MQKKRYNQKKATVFFLGNVASDELHIGNKPLLLHELEADHAQSPCSYCRFLDLWCKMYATYLSLKCLV